MKKYLRIFALLAIFASAMAVSCKKETWAPGPNQEFVEPHVAYDGSGLSTDDFVDMGGKVLWSSKNLGAETPVEDGDYYSWGETETKDDYSIGTYKYTKKVTVNNKEGNCYTKYADSEYASDALYQLLPEDDAATAALGDGYRMPSREEMLELLNSNKVTWVHYNDKPGLLIESEKTGNKIFLAASGYYLKEAHHNALYYVNSAHCYYLTNELYAQNKEEGLKDTNYYSDENKKIYRGDPQDAIDGGFSHASILFARYDTVKMGIGNRSWGIPVRPVKVM